MGNKNKEWLRPLKDEEVEEINGETELPETFEEEPEEEVVEETPEPTFDISEVRLVVNCQLLNLRDKPSKETGAVLRILKQREEVRMLEDCGDWFKVETNDKTIGYLMKEFVDIVK